MMHRLFVISLAASGLIATRTAAQSLAPEDFAYGMRLAVEDSVPVQGVVLPLPVYQAVTRADLGDVRVFNAGGEEVPHAVYRSAPPAQTPAPRSLPFFPLRGRPNQDIGDLSVQVRSTPSGALVQVEQRTGRTDAQPTRAYLVDATDLDEPIQELTFAWADTAADFITNVVAETSDDLTTWQRWGEPATLARLRYSGSTLRRDAMPLPPRRARYLRLTWPAADAPPALATLRVTPATALEAEREWARLDASVPEPNRYLFDQQGVLPADRARLDLPQSNTLARVELASADDPDGPWTPRFAGLVYRLQVQGHELTSPPIALPRVADRYWRLEVDPAGGGIGQAAPVLALGWVPERLLFIPRGDGPYTLAYGSAGARPSGFDPDELLRLLPDRRDGLLQAQTAEMGEIVELGGPARLEASADIPWQRLLLWSVLVLGVAMLALMAVRLLRQIDRDRRAVAGKP